MSESRLVRPGRAAGGRAPGGQTQQRGTAHVISQMGNERTAKREAKPDCKRGFGEAGSGANHQTAGTEA